MSGLIRLQQFTQSASVAATSGTAINFTGIPSWTNLIIASFYQISLSGSASIRIQLGTSGGIVTSGYLGSTSNIDNGISPTVSTLSNGFLINTGSAAHLHSGSIILSRNTGNSWVGNLNSALSNSAKSMVCAGGIALADTLTQLRFASSNGTDTFDSGSISIGFR
jgi:hypothetical protein